MIVVSDASPLSALIRIGEPGLLRRLFSPVVIPPKIQQEVFVLEKFGYDLRELRESEWLRVQGPTNLEMVRRINVLLDAGEAEAIALAEELHADYLLMDEKRGRMVASSRGLRVIGVLGILVLAKKKGLIKQVKPYITRLRTDANMWIGDDLELAVLKQVREA